MRISGEHVYPVATARIAEPDPTTVAGLPSTIYRGRTVHQTGASGQAGFSITNETAPGRLYRFSVGWVAAGHRVSGGAHQKLLSPQANACPTGTSFGVFDGRRARFTGAPADPAKCHRVLSYDLLDENEQTLFRRLSVFVGGCTMDAVEPVVADQPDTPPDPINWDPCWIKVCCEESRGMNEEPRS